MITIVITCVIGTFLALGAVVGALILVVRKLPPTNHQVADIIGRNQLAAYEQGYARGVAAGQGRPQLGAWGLEVVPETPAELRKVPPRPVDDDPVLIGTN